MKCPRCQKDLPDDVLSCPGCGLSFDDVTRRLDAPHSETVNRSQTTTSFDSIDDARFVPGTILAERYRIVGLLGKGGMGEVYRADDLKLAQPVALKFLSEELSRDREAIARLYREVRIARQVSHPNVCRVYDIGEIDGHTFLSMEFIKGEELSSLLRRIGRLPSDKATEIAHQICAGLAAAHNRGVLHRDLKPANVMIDEHGNARLTDFGIAARAEDLQGDVARAGTPAYMSPEQLAGKELTVKSDIYSLGLVLYEVFTGKKAFEAPGLVQMLELRKSDSTPATPSSLVQDIDPLVERVILRCLEKDPDERPASALQVSSALPGGDPLAAALAVGETPSPEAVAAAPTEGTLRPAIAVTCLASVLGGLMLVVFLSDRTKLYRQFPIDKSPDVLQDRAKELIGRLGYTQPPVDSAHGLTYDQEYINYLFVHDKSATRWDRLRTGQPSVIVFWYRTSPRYLVPLSRVAVRTDDPPERVPGMLTVSLDMKGRLINFEAVPPHSEETSASSAEPDWSALFAEAGLSTSDFTRAESKLVPEHYADARAAWEGKLPSQPDIPIRIEAAAYRGKPINFEISYPWNAPGRADQVDSRTMSRVAQTLIFVAVLVVMCGAFFLALRNLRVGLGDRKGAFRLATFLFTLNMISQWVLGAHHIPHLQTEFNIFTRHFAISLFYAALLWSIYIALEPFVRRRWPHRIISWSRLLGGDFSDPLVGRDVLIGGLFGVGINLLYCLWTLAPKLFGRPASLGTSLSGFGSFRSFLQELLLTITQQSLLLGLALLLMLLFLSFILRKDWLTAVGCWALLTLSLGSIDHNLPIDLFFAGLICALIIFAAVRFGLVVSVSLFLFLNISYGLPMTSDFSVWYAPLTIFALILLAVLASLGCYVSLGGSSLWNKAAS